MILNDLKALVCSEEVVVYEEYGKPLYYGFDCCGIYYDENDNEMYYTFGNREVEAIYTDGNKLIIDIGQEDVVNEIMDN